MAIAVPNNEGGGGEIATRTPAQELVSVIRNEGMRSPPGKLDVYNDLDDGVVGFFRVLRDRPDEIVARLELTPYARSEWEHARRSWMTTRPSARRSWPI